MYFIGYVEQAQMLFRPIAFVKEMAQLERGILGRDSCFVPGIEKPHIAHFRI